MATHSSILALRIPWTTVYGPASWETYMQVRMQQLELDMEQQTGFNRKRSLSRLYIVTSLFNLYAEYIMRNAGLEET